MFEPIDTFYTTNTYCVEFKFAMFNHDQSDPAVKPASLLVYVDRNNNHEYYIERRYKVSFSCNVWCDYYWATAQQKPTMKFGMRN